MRTADRDRPSFARPHWICSFPAASVKRQNTHNEVINGRSLLRPIPRGVYGGPPVAAESSDDLQAGLSLGKNKF
jgi:hypothetical protein